MRDVKHVDVSRWRIALLWLTRRADAGRVWLMSSGHVDPGEDDWYAVEYLDVALDRQMVPIDVVAFRWLRVESECVDVVVREDGT